MTTLTWADYRVDWPQPERWTADPRLLLQDFELLNSSFNRFVLYDGLMDRRFDYVTVIDMGWGYYDLYARAFIERLTAAQGIRYMPLSADRLNRISEIVRTVAAIGKNDSANAVAHRQLMLAEATEIFALQRNILREFVRLCDQPAPPTSQELLDFKEILKRLKLQHINIGLQRLKNLSKEHGHEWGPPAGKGSRRKHLFDWSVIAPKLEKRFEIKFPDTVSSTGS